MGRPGLMLVCVVPAQGDTAAHAKRPRRYPEFLEAALFGVSLGPRQRVFVDRSFGTQG